MNRYIAVGASILMGTAGLALGAAFERATRPPDPPASIRLEEEPWTDLPAPPTTTTTTPPASPTTTTTSAAPTPTTVTTTVTSGRRTAPVVTTTTTTTAAPVTTTTTTPAPSTPQALATADVGRSAADFGCVDFWCACYAESVLSRLGWQDEDPMDSPAQLRRLLPEVTEPAPGDLVFFRFAPYSHNTADHVAVIESLDPLVVIDGNGASTTHVGRWSPPAETYEVTGYGRFS